MTEPEFGRRLDAVPVGFFWHDDGWNYYVGISREPDDLEVGSAEPGGREAIPWQAEIALFRFELGLTLAFRGGRDRP